MATCVSSRDVVREYLRNDGVTQVNSIRTTALAEFVEEFGDDIWFGKLSKEWSRDTSALVIYSTDMPMHPNAGALQAIVAFHLYPGKATSQSADDLEVLLRRCLHGLRGANTQHGVIISADKLTSSEMPDDPKDLALVGYFAEYDITVYNRE